MSEKYMQIPKCVLVKSVPHESEGKLTINKGQRIDIFDGWGVGKYTLMGIISGTRTLEKQSKWSN